VSTTGIRYILARVDLTGPLVRHHTAALVIAGLLACAAPASAQVTEDEPWDSTRIPIELQSWWTPAFGHMHAAMRLPLGQEVSGILEFDVRVVLHNNPSTIYKLSIHDDDSPKMEMALDLHCPYDGVTPSTCAFNVPVSLDTTLFNAGWREIRVRLKASTIDGNTYVSSSAIPLNVENGKTDDDEETNMYCGHTSLIGRGWYTDIGYANGIIRCVPQAPVSGVHVFEVKVGSASSHLNVSLDKTHHIPAVGP